MPDPGNPQRLNQYSYCLNNPLRYVDPDGHDYGVDSLIELYTKMATGGNLNSVGLSFGYEKIATGIDIFSEKPEQVTPGILIGELLVSGNKGIVTQTGY